MYASEETQEDLLSAYFDKSASAVRYSFGRFESELARPTVRYILVSFKEHPIRSTFFAVYAALGVLPLLSFIGFSVFIFSSFVFFALCTAILAGLSVVLFFGFWLACALAFLFFLSVPITASTLSTYLLIRFALITRREGSVRGALSQWASETKGQFYKRSATDEQAQDETLDEHGGHSLMVGSVVLDSPASIAKETHLPAEPDGLSVAEDAKVES